MRIFILRIFIFFEKYKPQVIITSVYIMFSGVLRTSRHVIARHRNFSHKVYSWGNLTPGAGKHHLLSRADQKYEPPLLALVKPSQSPEFKSVTQVLRFKLGNSLVTPKVKDAVDHLSCDQMTLVVLSKPEEREKNRFLKFDASTRKKRKSQFGVRLI